MGAFIASLSAFSSLPGRAQGLCRAVEARRVRGAGHGAAGALPPGRRGSLVRLASPHKLHVRLESLARRWLEKPLWLGEPQVCE